MTRSDQRTVHWITMLALATASMSLNGCGSSSSAPVSTPGPATPTLVQWISYANDLTSTASQGWVTRLPNRAQGGNAIVVFVTTDNNPIGNITVTDDKSDTYTAEKSEYAGGQMVALFVAVNVTAGAQVITVNINTGGNTNEVALFEFQNIATSSPMDTTGCAASLTTGTTLTCGSFTTGTSGDLVLECGYIVSFSTTPTAYMTWTAKLVLLGFCSRRMELPLWVVSTRYKLVLVRSTRR